MPVSRVSRLATRQTACQYSEDVVRGVLRAYRVTVLNASLSLSAVIDIKESLFA